MMVRDGKLVATTCPECGCRLHSEDGIIYRHYGTGGFDLIDARGCKCSLVTMALWMDKKGPFLTSTGPHKTYQGVV